jgi:hypothetical protein
MTVVISNFSTNSSDFLRDLLESMGRREALEDAHEQGLPMPGNHRRSHQHGPTPTLSNNASQMGSDRDSTSALLEVYGREPSYTNKQRLVPVKGAPVNVLAAAAAQLGLQSHQKATSSTRPQPTHSLVDEGLTSWGAHQCAAFKAQWLEAAATNKLQDSELGTVLHEVELAEYLKQNSATPFLPSSTENCSSSNGSSGNISGSSSLMMSIDAGRGQRRQATFGGRSGSSKSGSVDSMSWMQWLAFAEPPDIAVPSNLRMAAFITTPSGSSNGRYGGSNRDSSEA